jgi:Inner membrane component of T3SS, cytoplasmic domain
MSFRLFVYYAALIGAWTAMLGWLLGRWLSDRWVDPTYDVRALQVMQAAVRGLSLGTCVAFGLGLLDALWNLGWRNILQVLGRLAVAIVLGGLGGMAGGGLAMFLLLWSGQFAFVVVGWTIAGLALGASISALEFIRGRFDPASTHATGKFIKCAIGGMLGGLVGSGIYVGVQTAWLQVTTEENLALFWSPTALGYVALGLFIGLLVALVQVVLKDAWIRVERGFRPGREMLLSKNKYVIGRAESSDIAMFGDPAVELTHAVLIHHGAEYAVEDAGSSTGTFVNDTRISQRTVLHSGDLIRVGQNVMRFSESGPKRR